MTNAMKATMARDKAAVRLRLSSDGMQVLIEVWDADLWPPTAAGKDEDGGPDPQAERARAVPGGGVERAVGLVSHRGIEGQGRLVRDRGVTARGVRSGRRRITELAARPDRGQSTR